MSAKSRTKILVRDPIGPTPKERQIHNSAFLVTINPNEVFRDVNSPEARMMIARCRALGDFLLKKKNILAALTFQDRKPAEGEPQIVLSREEHLNKIVSISQDRAASVEIGSKYHKIHLHLSFEIQHRTYLHLRRDFYLNICSAFFKKDKSKIHLNFRAATIHKGYKQYVNKNESEDVEHLMDNAVAEFYKEDVN